MARAPLLQLSDISLTFGGDPLFSGLDAVIQPGDRLALVGRNGSGKSTLLKVMAGLVEPDSGQRVLSPGTTVGYMEQSPDLSGFETLGQFATATLGPDRAYRVEMVAEGLAFDPQTPVAQASGGERRRAALARLLAAEPELLLLDEPTNHLDIAAIRWLERMLAGTRSAFVTISHDRAFLRSLTRGILWIDRGQVRRLDKGFDAFEDWRDRVWAEEDLARHKLDRKIRAEARWAVEGISARRRRNQGRLRALQALRAERAAQIARKGAADLMLEEAAPSGKLVIEARGISKSFGQRTILRDVSIRIARGERIAIIGPNGAGKTTLLKLLTGEIPPDEGSVRLGHNLEMAVFDQNRAALDPDATLWESLTGDEAMRVRGRSDQVMVRGTPRHVVGYLKDFLFDEAQARAPVRALSGGEQARLLLARIMARSSNLLVLDEPTNDLDVETLDLLQDVLSEYGGTVLLVSHDRDFIDRIATTSLVMTGNGRVTICAGGWTDAIAQLGGDPFAPEDAAAGARTGGGGRGGKSGAREARDGARGAEARAKAGGTGRATPGGSAGQGTSPAPAATATATATAARRGLTFAQRHRLKELPARIDRLSAEIARLEEFLSDPDLFQREPVKFAKASEALVERQTALREAEDEWLELEALREAEEG